MKKNRGIIHIAIIIIGILVVLVILGFFNSVERNAELLPPTNYNYTPY